jgi:hypothetical protein
MTTRTAATLKTIHQATSKMILKSKINRADQPAVWLKYDPKHDAWQPDTLQKQLAAYQKLGVTHLRWICQVGACDLCTQNDGQVVELGQAFPNGNILPQCHPNCDCQVIPVSSHHTITRSNMTTKVKRIPNPAPGAPSTPTPMPDPENIERAQIFIPIMRVDQERRMIEGQATVEDLDKYETVFSYEASKRAFEAWEGNIREMHGNVAVGRALEVEFDDDNKLIVVRCFISKGAEPTWQKILDGTLRGFSVGAKAPKSAWKTIERNGKAYPFLTSYSLAELSVVDNPATPGCNFAIMRADGYTDVLAPDSELDADPAQSDATHNRDLSTTMAGLHSIRDTAMTQCGCDSCYAFLAGSYGRADEADLTSHFTPTLQRLDAISAGLATRNTDMAGRFAAMERQIAALTQLVQQSMTKADETRTDLATIQQTVSRVADQPLSGGPVRNTNGQSVSQLDERALLKMAAEKGLLSSDDQMAAAAKLLLGSRKGK